MELNTEEWLLCVADSFVGFIICIDKKLNPIFGKGFGVDSEPMILTCDEASTGVEVSTWLIVATVTVSERCLLYLGADHVVAYLSL